MTMSIPVWVLLAFAVWTMLVLMLTVGIYRWGLIFTGRAEVKEFRADRVEGSDWYRRSMRAHLNCVENLPVYGLTRQSARSAWPTALPSSVA